MAESERRKGPSEAWEALKQLGGHCRADAAVRARIADGDLSDLDLELPAGMEIRVVEQSADTY